MTRAAQIRGRGKPLARLLGAAVRAHPLLCLGIVVAQVVTAASTLAEPAFNASIIDGGIVAGNIAHIERVAALMVVVAVIGLAAGLAVAVFGAELATRTTLRARRRLYRQAMALGHADFHRLGPATLITRTGSDTTTVSSALYSIVGIAASAPLLIVGSVIGAVRTSVGLTPLMAVVAVVLSITVGVLATRMLPLAERTQRAVDAVGATLREQLSGVRVIRSFGRERHESLRFATYNDDLTALARRTGVLQVMVQPAVLIIANLAIVAATALGATLIEHGDLQIGQLTAFTGYLAQVIAGVSMLVAVVAVLPRASVSAGRIDEVLSLPASDATGESFQPEPRLGRHCVAGAVPAGATSSHRGAGGLSLEFRHVSYRYPDADQPAVAEVSLRCAPNTMTAILGGTAAGKSTLLSLVPRLTDTDTGAILVGGVDIRRWDPSTLRRTVAYVGQGRVLVAGDVAANLRLGQPAASDEALWTALRLARADDFVRARDGGLAAPVTQGGANFSGGQRQRLAIARALVGLPRVLCLDDSFSAVNLEVAHSILAGVRRAMPDCTVLLAVQQAELARAADTVAVLDHGRLQSRGRHVDVADFDIRALPREPAAVGAHRMLEW